MHGCSVSFIQSKVIAKIVNTHLGSQLQVIIDNIGRLMEKLCGIDDSIRLLGFLDQVAFQKYSIQIFLVNPALHLWQWLQQGVKIIGAFWNLECILQWNQPFSIDHNSASYSQNCTIQKPAYRETFQLFNDTKFIDRNASQPKILTLNHKFTFEQYWYYEGVRNLWINFSAKNFS